MPEAAAAGMKDQIEEMLKPECITLDRTKRDNPLHSGKVQDAGRNSIH